jgi:hypothetical protein
VIEFEYKEIDDFDFEDIDDADPGEVYTSNEITIT